MKGDPIPEFFVGDRVGVHGLKGTPDMIVIEVVNGVCKCIWFDKENRMGEVILPPVVLISRSGKNYKKDEQTTEETVSE